jgi:hypothetical protein
MAGDALWEAADKGWFRDHPGVRVLVRESYGEEFDGGQIETHSQFCVRYADYADAEIVGIGSYTIVVKIDDTTRMRLPYWRSDASDADLGRIPVEAELREGGKTTSLREFLARLDAAAAVSGAVTEMYLEEVLPAFMVDSISYDGENGPSQAALAIMLACFEPAADESATDSHEVRPATAEDHGRHSAHGGYDPADFPAVLIVQPYPGLFFRMPFPRPAMKDSDGYRFRVSAGGRSGTLGEYLTQARHSLRFATNKT